MRGPFIGCATGARRGADEPLEGSRKASRRGNKDCRGPSVVAPRLASTAKAGQTASSRGKPAQAEFGPMYRARLFQLSRLAGGLRTGTQNYLRQGLASTRKNRP